MFLRQGIKILLIVLICSLGYCSEEEQTSVYELKNFTKGLNSNTSEFLLGDTYLAKAENIRFDRTLGGFGKRTVMKQSLDLGSEPIKSIHRYYKTDGTQYTIASHGTVVTASTSDSVQMNIGESYSDGKRWSWTTYKDNAIGMNGVNNAIKFDGLDDVNADTDGNRTADNLVADVGGPFAELNTGTDLDADSWYMYKVAFYDTGTSTYYYSDARSNAILTGSSVYNIALTDIPLGDTTIDERYIYRTLGNSSKANALADTTYYLVDTISDNSTQTYSDSSSDATISADNAPTWATVSAGTEVTPPVGKYSIIHQNRLWIAGDSNNPSYLYHSDIRNPDFFDPADVFYVREDDGDEITGLSELISLLTIYKTNSILKIYTNTTSESAWSGSDAFSFIGCPAPYTIQTTPIGDIYLGRDGLYLFTGQKSTLLSLPIQDKIDDINQSEIKEVASYFHDNNYYLSYSSVEAGATENDSILIYNVQNQCYTTDDKSIDSFEAFKGGTDDGILYFGSSLDDGIIYADEEATPVLSKRFKSEFDAGTYDDTNSFGTESSPEIELSWSETIDELSGTIDAMTGIIDRPATTGTWISPVYEINATTLDTLYWNENLSTTGDITWAIRTGASESATESASWSGAYSDPTGTDISGETANVYIQLKATLTTTDIALTPELLLADGYVFKLTYTSVSSTTESSVLSVATTGWLDFGVSGYNKSIERIKVYYQGDTGTITFKYWNDENTVDEESFTITLNTEPDDDYDDEYTGYEDNKIYTQILSSEGIIGQFFKFQIEEDSTGDFQIERIEIVYSYDESEDL